MVILKFRFSIDFNFHFQFYFCLIPIRLDNFIQTPPLFSGEGIQTFISFSGGKSLVF